MSWMVYADGVSWPWTTSSTPDGVRMHLIGRFGEDRLSQMQAVFRQFAIYRVSIRQFDEAPVSVMAPNENPALAGFSPEEIALYRAERECYAELLRVAFIKEFPDANASP